jgi:hypothetical protein
LLGCSLDGPAWHRQHAQESDLDCLRLVQVA